MIQPKTFYKSRITLLTQAISKLKKLLLVSSMMRLLVFLLICFGIYFFFGNVKAIVIVVIVGAVGFVYLIHRHSKLQYRRDLTKALIKLNQTELNVLDKNFKQLPTGIEFEQPAHYFAQDIDLFGEGSFYQYLNRTTLEGGKKLLAKMMLSNDIEDIPLKQEAIEELSALPQWRQNFSGIASLVKTEVASKVVVQWLKDHKSFIPAFMKNVPAIFSILSLAILTLYFLNIVPEIGLTIWFLLGLGISGAYVKKINTLSAHISKIQSTFEQYHKLLAEIESKPFSASLLKKKRGLVIGEHRNASQILRKFAKHLDALDQRSNILIGIFTNAFMLRDIQQVFRIEKWINEHKKEVAQWFDVIAFFDAYNSFGNFRFNHPSYHFPKIEKNDSLLISAKKLGHPLLGSEVCVTNDFEINEEQFFIITGANMAGKSTFLRTVSLQIVMSNLGLPVFANNPVYHPIKLITSMRTTDSLSKDESYFFSELKRLKFIVDEIKSDRYFIILDEILKGTNSTDKALGSRKFIDKLVHSQSTGIIATHDLSLCEAAKELKQVSNYFFDAIIENDELYFDYVLKEGVCQNMNASFLLKKMEIVD